MIRFSLRCGQGHDFEGWFASNADYDAQVARQLVSCPLCGSADVEKALMAPSVAVSHGDREGGEAATPVMLDGEKAKIAAAMKALARMVRENAENVGERFAEEARRIHYGEVTPRGIYGKADPTEAKALVEEGIPIAPLPFPIDDVH